MTSDLALVVGIVLGVFALPAIASAFAERRALRGAAVMVIAAGVLIVVAVQTRPGGYTWADVPQAFVRVVADVLN